MKGFLAVWIACALFGLAIWGVVIWAVIELVGWVTSQ